MQYTLTQGSHSNFNPQDCCAMELVAHLNGEEHSDRPQCVHPVIAAYARQLNDLMPDDARNSLLLPLILSGKLSGTTELDSQSLAYMCADRAVRVFAGVDCDPIVDADTAVDAARAAGAADADAADAAAWVATRASAAWAEAAGARAADAAATAAWAADAAADATDWKQAVQLLEDMCEQ